MKRPLIHGHHEKHVLSVEQMAIAVKASKIEKEGINFCNHTLKAIEA